MQIHELVNSDNIFDTWFWIILMINQYTGDILIWTIIMML